MLFREMENKQLDSEIHTLYKISVKLESEWYQCQDVSITDIERQIVENDILFRQAMAEKHRRIAQANSKA